MNKPHIFLILSDQHNARIAGFAGDSYIRTPHLDNLASESVSLENCYCPSPLCVPSRMSMLTGQLPSSTNVWTNEQGLSSDIPTFVHSLNTVGYTTTLCGRMHFVGPDQRHGYEHRLVGDICPTLLGGESGIQAAENDPLKGTTGSSKQTVAQSGYGNSRVLQYDKAVTDSAVSWIKKIKEKAAAQFLTIGLYSPHCSFVAPKDVYEYYYNTLPDPVEQCVPHQYQEDFNRRTNNGKFDLQDIKRVRAAYYGMIENMDTNIGRIVHTIDKEIGRKNCIIIYASDHGEMLGEKDLLGKTHFYDSSARVPFLISGPFQQGVKSTEPTSLLDLSPTLCTIAGAPELPLQHGKDISPILKGEYSDTNRIIISQFATTVDGYVSGMARNKKYKYICYIGYEKQQLFDMENDPFEEHNLIDNPDLQHVKESLHRELWKHWEPKKISDYVKRSWAEGRIIQKSNTKQKIIQKEVWPGNKNDNQLYTSLK